MKLISFLLLFVGLEFQSNGQDGNAVYPTVGVLCPDFHLSDVEYFSKKEVSTLDFRGKWLILDFWNRMCSGCVQSFPQTNELQRRFSGNVQVLLIGYTGSQYVNRSDDKEIRKLYNQVKKRANLELPIAYDSILFKRFDIMGCPFIVVVDPNGIVKAVTSHISAEDINDLMSGKSPLLAKAWRWHEDMLKFDASKPFLIHGNGGSDTNYLYRSLLSRWEVDAPSNYHFNIINNRLQVLGVELKKLYNYGYFHMGSWIYDDSLYGKVYPEPILELRDSSYFKPDYYTRRNMFCYSLSMPSEKSSIESFAKIVRSDLSNYFGYSAHVENRMMPTLSLVRINNVKESVGSVKLLGNFEQKFTTRELLRNIYSQHGEISVPFVDDTGITGNINPASSLCNQESLDQCKTCLIKYGLDLIWQLRPMTVLVVRDPADDSVKFASKK